MSGKNDKAVRRQVRKEAQKIQVDALRQWQEFIKGKSIWSRFKFCVKLFFSRLPKI